MGVGGGARLACDGHVPVEIAGGGIAAGDHVHHGIGQQEGGGLLDNLLGAGDCVVQYDITVRVDDPCIELGLGIGSHIGDGSVGGIQLIGGHAVGQTAQGQRLVHVRIYLAVIFRAVRQGGKAKVEQIIIAQLGRDCSQRLHGNDVQGVPDAVPDILNAAEIP